MSGRVGEDPPPVLVWLKRQLLRAEFKEPGFGVVKIFDREVEMKLLRHALARPARSPVIVHPLEADEESILAGKSSEVVIRDGERIYRTYFVDSRGDEAMGSTWSYLDITALGRQEEWEDSPEGYPQTPPYAWWNYHDAYSTTP